MKLESLVHGMIKRRPKKSQSPGDMTARTGDEVSQDMQDLANTMPSMTGVSNMDAPTPMKPKNGPRRQG